MASSPTGGVKPMAIAGRMVRERERLAGMSAEERSWRAQWLKDQHLAPNEPVAVPEYKRALENPIRRIYKAPLDGLYKALCPILVTYQHGHYVTCLTSMDFHINLLGP